MPTILLVEDSKFLRVATERVLTRAGFTVISVGDGDEVWRIAANRLPDLIVLDMLLPNLSGPEVLRSLKKNVLTAHIPVVVSSSLSQKNEAKLVREGACAFIEKGPLLENPDLLLETIRIALAKSGAKSMTPGSPHPEVEVQ
jgi:two-component system cell cycle response regulator DivK